MVYILGRHFVVIVIIVVLHFLCSFDVTNLVLVSKIVLYCTVCTVVCTYLISQIRGDTDDIAISMICKITVFVCRRSVASNAGFRGYSAADLTSFAAKTAAKQGEATEAV